MKAPKQSILHLSLKREFFAEIVAKEKHVEYREQKPYWKKRLEGRHYDIVRFRNGYGKTVPEMDVEFLGIRRYGKGRGGKYAISLGDILTLKRWNRARKSSAAN